MFLLKLLILKSVLKLGKLFGRGSSLPGYLEMKYNFNVVKQINFSNAHVIFVLGTNGKTTTSNLISQSILKNEYVINNSLGANLTSGILTTIIENTTFNKKLKSEIIVLEVDEKTLKNVVKYIKPNQVVVTNFFRDQLDRYGEIDITIKEITNVLGEIDCEIHLNGCDPLVVDRFDVISNKKYYYGVENHLKTTKEQNKIIEIKYCPKCNTELNYNYYHYSHIGNYDCTNCSFKTPKLSTSIEIDYQNNLLVMDEKSIEMPINKIPLYFNFNIASALSVLKTLENPKYNQSLEEIIIKFKEPKGRNQLFEVNGKKVYYNLAKNVVGMEETLDLIKRNNKTYNFVIAFNDNHADGLDVSWIWDVDVSVIKPAIKELTITGSRRYDMAIRFDVEGIEKINVNDSIEKTIKEAINSKEDVIIITNYTPLAEISKILNKECK